MGKPEDKPDFSYYNTELIDYVIYYKYSDQSVGSKDFKLKETNRNKFLGVVKNKLKLNKELKFKTENETHHYILLHCPLESLLEQAETIKLELRLKDAKLDDHEWKNNEIKWIRKVKDFILRRKPIEKDDLGDNASMPFELSMKDLFCGCDGESLANTKEPFSSSTRSLLVHSILNPSQESVEGLEYLIKNKYFDDAFILHCASRNFINLVQLIDLARQAQLNEEQLKYQLKNERPFSVKKKPHDGEVRDELYVDWAKFTNIFKSQPLSKIRRYFGESVAFYFAWIGTFIWTLILPSFIGFVFFIAGIVIRFD
ncbi:anoctamin-4 isoform X1 [Brachionus plicatilis]|uniref:Anoctamin n=1 Tax=Brachionus plicatilis TaxID=10195 RepID=A0A3M7SEC0_BRAPC|nr:anoctamin-4 isoform X1 [Brachionus plicatilis]